MQQLAAEEEILTRAVFSLQVFWGLLRRLVDQKKHVEQSDLDLDTHVTCCTCWITCHRTHDLEYPKKRFQLARSPTLSVLLPR